MLTAEWSIKPRVGGSEKKEGYEAKVKYLKLNFRIKRAPNPSSNPSPSRALDSQK